MSPEAIAITGTLGGVLLASLFNVVNSWISKRSEERRQFRELIIKGAIEEWKGITERQLKMSERGYNVTFYPLDIYMVHMTQVCNTCLKSNVSRETLIREVRDAGATLDALIADLEAQQDQRNRDNPRAPVQ